MRKRILPILIMAVVFCLVFTACSGGNGDTTTTDGETTVSQGAEDTTESKDVPELENAVFGAFQSVDIEGNEVDYTVFEGKKLTMVNIWATFCGPCIREMPDLEKISKEYADKGFQIVGIVCDVSLTADGTHSKALLSEAEDVIENTGVTYLNILPSVSLNEAKLSEVYSVPETIFVDENGEQVGQYVGSKSYEDWCKIIDGLLGE